MHYNDGAPINIVMDIRQVKEAKPKLGAVADARFGIIHNLETISKHESLTARFLAEKGPQKVFTRKHLYSLSTKDGQTVEAVMTEPRPEGEPFLSFPEPVRLFCIEIGNLHANQQVFTEKAEDEVLQVIAELHDLSPAGELFVEQGRNVIQIREQDGRIYFQPPEVYAETPEACAEPTNLRDAYA
jgi:hypothetical protein